MLDSGTLLGIVIAKGQLKTVKKIPEVKKLISKCDILENRFINEARFHSESNRISEYFICDIKVYEFKF